MDKSTNSSNILTPQQDDSHLCGSNSEDNSLIRSDPTINRPPSQNALPCANSWKRIWKKVTIEPILFTHMFAMCLSGVVLQNLYIQRICTVTLATSSQTCDNLGNYTELG